MKYHELPFGRIEALGGAYAIASYLVYGAGYDEILKKTGGFAVGQSVGTWIGVPGITDEMVGRYQARVLGVYPAGDIDEQPAFLLRAAFPLENMGGSISMLLTALVGYDVSTALRARLVDIELSSGALGEFSRPRQGIGELRELCGVKDRPLVLNMIKPCLGFDSSAGADFFFQAAKGGLDMIKDDELLGSPSYNPLAKRTAAYLEAARSASEYSGKRTLYLPNITAGPLQMMDNAKAVLDAGGRACLVNFLFCGIDALMELCRELGDELFIMAHYAGAGIMSWDRGGIANPVLLGILPRLAGAHSVMTMYPDRENPEACFDFYRTAQAQRLPLGGIGPVVTAVGGGITPINQDFVQKELGHDTIIGIGGAVQGHPMGAQAGAQAAMAAVEASSKGISLEKASKENEPLRIALEHWGGR